MDEEVDVEGEGRMRTILFRSSSILAFRSERVMDLLLASSSPCSSLSGVPSALSAAGLPDSMICSENCLAALAT